MSSHSAERFSLQIAAGPALAFTGELAAAMPVLPGRPAAGDGDDLTTTETANSRRTVSDGNDVAGTTPKASGAYIYGYDSAGNPTLTDLGSSDHKLPGR